MNPRAILLTGAGFTQNFGGYLAADMWAAIFNHPDVQGNPDLQDAMRRRAEEFNYEYIYERVMTSNDFTRADRNGITSAIASAYDDMDEVIRNYDRATSAIDLNRVAGFTDSFGGDAKHPGYFFTLNQDLFIERRILPFEKLLDLPGIARGNRFTAAFQYHRGDGIQLPDEETVDRLRRDPNPNGAHLLYVKLHGSMEWLRHDGSRELVIGGKKEDAIQREPILRWYWQMFEDALKRENNRRLVVIGYGFGDKHVNALIAEACRASGLKVFVVTRRTAQEFFDDLWGRQLDTIYPHWAGHYRLTLRELFSRNAVDVGGALALEKLKAAVFAD